jgi:hypothetical protein
MAPSLCQQQRQFVSGSMCMGPRTTMCGATQMHLSGIGVTCISNFYRTLE